MQKRSSYFFLFLILFIIGLLVAVFSRNTASAPGGVISQLFTPIRETFIGMTRGKDTDEVKTLREENIRLQKVIRDQKKLEADVKALRDQFETENLRTRELLPAKIISMPQFIAGVSLPESIILNKGSSDGVTVGQVVLYQDNVIGKIVKASSTTSLVDLIYHQKSTISAKTLKTNALGIIRGQGQGVMQLQGVVLSEKLEIGDQVLTKGDGDGITNGYPPDLVIGKIISVNKQPSALFQTAEVESLIPIIKLTTVFIVKSRN